MPHDPHHPLPDESAADPRGVQRTPAPGGEVTPTNLPACPFCHSTDIEPLSPFGAQLMTEQYYCRACRTPFERIKDSLL